MPPKRDVLYWMPDPVEEALKNLEPFTIDSEMAFESNPKRGRAMDRLIGAAVVNDDGTFTSWHITDNPFEMEHVLARGRDLAEGRSGDLCGGFYLSTAVDMWKSRSRKKWNFLDDLGEEGIQKLMEEIRRELLKEVTTHYISQNEYDQAMRALDLWVNEGNTYGPIMVANQPYNINIQKLALEKGIATPFEPHIIQVDFTGRYLDLTLEETSQESAYLAAAVLSKSVEEVTQKESCKVLRDQGWDGAFSRAAFGTNPELVIWNADKILRFGRWKRSEWKSSMGNLRLSKVRNG